MLKKLTIKLAALCTIVLGTQLMTACNNYPASEVFLSGGTSEYVQLNGPAEGEEIAVLTTNKGVIKMRFFPQYAPKAVENFIKHAKDGYYNDVTFHRIINEFMIQGGDPLGTGMGGESIWGGSFGLEVVPELHHIRGAVSMANTGQPDSNGSQFFIVQNTSVDKPTDQGIRAEFEYLRDNQDEVLGVDETGREIPVSEYYPKEVLEFYLANGGSPSLDFQYTVFAQVFEGMNIVDDIAAVAVNGDSPLEKIVIKKISFENYKK